MCRCFSTYPTECKVDSINFVNHGRVAIIYSKEFATQQRLTDMKMKTFELVGCMITSQRTVLSAQRTVLSVLFWLYTGQDQVRILNYFSTADPASTLLSCHVLIIGDINIHLDQLNDTANIKLQDISSTFKLVQHVRTATYTKGHTLDLFITRMDTCPFE